MSERKSFDSVLNKIGDLLKSKREALGAQGKTRQSFIDSRSAELFNYEDWISLRYLSSIEQGKNMISIEKLILLSKALEVDPVDLFSEIVSILAAD